MMSQNKKQTEFASTIISLLVLFALLLPFNGWSQSDTVEKLIKELKDEDSGVRRRAAGALWGHQDARAVEPLIAALKDEDLYVRRSAAWALGGLKDARAVEPLIAALKDENSGVRQNAAWALGELKDARAVEPLIAALKDENSGVRQSAAYALGELKDARAVEPLIAALKGEDEHVQESAAYALGKIKDARAVAPLIAALKDEECQWSAAWALVELKDARAVEPLIAALKDEDSGVRGRAALALDSIGGVKAQAALSGRAEYTYFALNVVNHPQFFSPGVVFSIEIEAKNVSDQTFATGDITVSFQGAVVCEVMTHNATAMKQLPKGSRIFSVEKQRSIRSEDLIVQALKEKWRPHEAVHVRLQLQFTTFDQSLAMLVRVAGKLTGRKELIFEPRSGAKDQQGLNSEHFPLMEDLD